MEYSDFFVAMVLNGYIAFLFNRIIMIKITGGCKDAEKGGNN